MSRIFTFVPVTLDAIKSFVPVILNRQVNSGLAITGFTSSIETWAGASRIFALQGLALPAQAFSIRAGQRFPYTTFFVCVKWVSGGIVKRYKLWNPAGALLSYPLYAGEIIPSSGAELEYWSTTTSAPTITVPSFSIITDIIEAPADCCSQTGTALANGICSIGNPTTLNGMFYQCRT
jgi:hypothetical protein